MAGPSTAKTIQFVVVGCAMMAFGLFAALFALAVQIIRHPLTAFKKTRRDGKTHTRSNLHTSS